MFMLHRGISYLLMVLTLFTCSKKSTDDEKPPPFMYRCSDFEAAWSPDGKTIAFISGGNPDKEIPAGLYFVDSDGKNRRIFIEGAKVYSPDWSPDGEWIVFSNYAQIYKMKTNGDSLTQLTSAEDGECHYPKWSPDGKRILYAIGIGEKSGTWMMNFDGTDKRKTIMGYYPDWRAGSSQIVYVGSGAEIWVADTNGTNAKRLTSLNSITQYPQWSPDGSKIVFSSMKASPPQIYVMNADGTNLKQLTNTGCDYPAWSPDGNHIVYTDVRQLYGRLFIMNADGTSKEQLTFDE